MKKLNRAAVLLFLTVMTLGMLASCTKDGTDGRFRFPLSGEPRQLDPQVSIDDASVTVMASIFEGLAALDEDGNAIPGAAEWVKSPDGKLYTFTLRDSKWNNDTPVTADDFVYAIRRTVDPATKSQIADRMFFIVGAREIAKEGASLDTLGVRAVSERVLEITLTEPNDNFPIMTATVPYYPCNREFFEQSGGKYGLEDEFTLSNGPFYVERWQHGESLLLYRNDGYHGAADITPSAVRYMIKPEENPLAVIASGDLDAARVAGEKYDEATRLGLKTVLQQDTVQMLWFNTTFDGLHTAKARTALRDTLEWNAITAELDEKLSLPATGFVSPAAVLADGQHYRETASTFVPGGMGVSQAAELLREGLDEEGVDKLEKLTLLCADNDYDRAVARMLVQSWQKNLQLYFSIEHLTTSALEARVRSGNYQIALYTSSASGSGAIDALSRFSDGVAGNFSKLSDAGYTAACHAANGGARSEIAALESRLWELCPAVPITFPCDYFVVTKDAENILLRPFNGGVHGAQFDFRHALKYS